MESAGQKKNAAAVTPPVETTGGRGAKGRAVRLLDPLVSARIAAGEVIENPASVVRELLDNALDAGARSITVELTAGGLSMIRVHDDGFGMSAEDLGLAVKKHATSKISSLEDLDTILSLGFRGEALFAIASVARMRIVSNEGSEGHEIRVDNGRASEPRAAPSPKGTSIEVQDLFKELPARKAFLKSAVSETRAVRRVLVEKMLSAPGVRFVFLSDGDTLLSSAAGDLASRIGDLFGADMVRDLIPLDYEEQGISCTGFIAPPHKWSATRREQFLIVNGRPLFMAFFSKALSTAYGNAFPASRYAIAFISLSLDPAALNANVHPTKREVRFKNEGLVFSTVVHAARKALADSPSLFTPQVHEPFMQDDGYKSAAERFSRAEPGTEKSPQHAMRHDTTRSAQSKYAGHRADSSGLAYKNRDAFYPPRGDVREAVSPYLPLARTAEREGAPAYDSGSAVDADTDAGAAASFFDEGVFAGARVTGCFGFNYWVCEQGDAILIVDQHAAHERVVYERFKKEYSAGGIRRQGLLIPISFTPHEGEREIIEEQGAAIREAGFSLAPFGKQNWIIDEYPAEVKDVLPALRSLLASLAESRDSEDTRRERVLATLACHAAVRRGDRIQAAFVCEILNELAALKKPFTCPHGRPSIVRFGKEEIEKWFARR